MFLNIFIVGFQENEQHKVYEIVGNQVGIANIIDDTVENDVPQLEHTVSQQLHKQLIALFSNFIEFLSVNSHIGVVDVDHPRYCNHKCVDH